MKIASEHIKILNKIALSRRLFSRGKISRSAAMRAVLDDWIGRACEGVELEPTRPDELEPFSFAIEVQQLAKLKDATVDWSTADLLVDQSTIVRSLLNAATIEVAAPLKQ